jgi:hypothetical protein
MSLKTMKTLKKMKDTHGLKFETKLFLGGMAISFPILTNIMTMVMKKTKKLETRK